MVQGYEDSILEFVVGEGVVSTGCVAFAIDERVMPHVLVAKADRLQHGSDGTLNSTVFHPRLRNPWSWG